MIKTIWSQQYGKPCVVASPADMVDTVIAACRASGAVILGTRAVIDEYGRGHSVHAEEDDEFVVQIRDNVGPELWTEASLRRSLGKEI